MDDAYWIVGLKAAGAFHFVAVGLAILTPIPANWNENLARLPEVHQRFAVAQNVFIGATMLVAGAVSFAFAADLVTGTALARVICGAIALWWAARLLVLPWLRVWPELRTPLLRGGFVLLHAQCAIFTAAYGWLALR